LASARLWLLLSKRAESPSAEAEAKEQSRFANPGLPHCVSFSALSQESCLAQKRREANLAAIEKTQASTGTWSREQKEREARERARALFGSRAQAAISKTAEWADKIELELREKLRRGQPSFQRHELGPSARPESQGHGSTEHLVGKRPRTPENLIAARARWIQKRNRRKALALARQHTSQAPPYVPHAGTEQHDGGKMAAGVDSEERADVEGESESGQSDEYDEEIDAAIQQLTSELFGKPACTLLLLTSGSLCEMFSASLTRCCMFFRTPPTAERISREEKVLRYLV